MRKKYFLDLEEKDIYDLVIKNGEKKFCAEQVIDWVYKKKVEDFLQFSNLSKRFREVLADKYILSGLKLYSKEVSKKDGTIKFKFKTIDEKVIPTVFLPKKDKNIVCISTQVGCGIGCCFCNSGKVEFERNLSQGEILEQVIKVENITGKKVNGILFMGMGEPLLNYENVILAIKKFINPKMFAIGRKHITVSTIGLVKKIYDLSLERLGIRLAISLHASNDIVRKMIVPTRISYKIEEILKSGLFYTTQNDSDLTIEYMILKNVNDSINFASELVNMFNKIYPDKKKVKVNLIPYNDTYEKKFVKPKQEKILEFQEYLKKNGFLTFIRLPQGKDINAGCGQLGC